MTCSRSARKPARAGPSCTRVEPILNLGLVGETSRAKLGSLRASQRQARTKLGSARLVSRPSTRRDLESWRGAGESDAAATAREQEARATASVIGHGADRHNPSVVATADDSYLPDEEAMESDGVFSQRFAAKRLRDVANTKLNPSKRRYINETGFGDLMSISPFIVPHDLLEWVAMSIYRDRRELRLSQNKVIVFTRDMVKKVFNIP